MVAPVPWPVGGREVRGVRVRPGTFRKRGLAGTSCPSGAGTLWIETGTTWIEAWVLRTGTGTLWKTQQPTREVTSSETTPETLLDVHEQETEGFTGVGARESSTTLPTPSPVLVSLVPRDRRPSPQGNGERR